MSTYLHRANPALPPSAGCEHVLVTRLMIEAAVRELIAHGLIDEEVAARHLLDEASRSLLLGRLHDEVVCVHRAMRRGDVIGAEAPVGSGRRHARDEGGRVAYAAAAVATELVDGVGGELRRRQREHLWALAHPVVERAVEAIRRLHRAVQVEPYRHPEVEISAVASAIADVVDPDHHDRWERRGRPCATCREREAQEESAEDAA